jgi:prepilin-type N-terminal cleavage/methylation domain-containing protein
MQEEKYTKEEKNTKKNVVFRRSGSVDFLFKRGFTFVEMLVAISVLLLSIVGPLFLASQGLRAARIARDQINANYLAQEAIEYVRFLRDNNALTRKSQWLFDIIPPCDSGCAIDIEEGLQTCSGDRCKVWFQEKTGRYGTPGLMSSSGDWIETKFSRIVTVEETVPDKEAKVTVIISWRDGAITRQYTLAETLLNWQQ